MSAKPDANGWRSIEDAPRDGSSILLGWWDEVGEGYWFDGAGNHWQEPGFRFTDDDKLTSHPIYPTHFQPLPNPPEPSK